MIRPGFDLATVRKLVGYFQTLNGLSGHTITVELTPGLKHQGEDAWAIVESDARRKFARVRVRDLVKTPLPAADPWHELKVTIAHELGHICVDEYLEAPSIEAEERLVERQAQALVRAGADAGALARGWQRAFQILPVAVRARVAKSSARARQGRARMKLTKEEVEKALASLGENPEGPAADALRALLASMLTGGEPDGDEVPPAREEPKPGEGPAAPPMGREDPKMGEPAMRAAARRISVYEVRAREAAEKGAGVTIRARLREIEAVDGVQLSEKKRAELAAMTDVDAFERRIGDILEGRATATPRARSGATVPAAPRAAGGGSNVSKYDEATLIKDGINPVMAKMIANEADPAVAEVAYNAARARISSSGSPWPTSGGVA